MKKILLLLLIMTFSLQICLAEEETIDDINSYFNQDTEQAQTINGYVQYN